MTLSTVGIGLFKTQGLDEYGTAAVGWLRGGGLKATEGPAEHRGGGIHTLAHTRRDTTDRQGSHALGQNKLPHETREANWESRQHSNFPSQLITKVRMTKLLINIWTINKRISCTIRVK